jgi:chromosome segregation ATPase
MNDPLGRIEDLERLSRDLQERVNRLEQQQTEPMHVTRIELDPGGIQNRLDNHAEMMKEQDEQLHLHTQAFQRVETLLNEHTETISTLQADVSSIKATQSDHGELLREILAQLRKEE